MEGQNEKSTQSDVGCSGKSSGNECSMPRQTTRPPEVMFRSTRNARWCQGVEVYNAADADGNPTGGSMHSTGLSIRWQDGPLGRGTEKREPNGAFVEDVVLAAIERLKFFQSSKYSCRENALALTHLEDALHWLQHRHDAREEREVQGLHKV